MPQAVTLGGWIDDLAALYAQRPALLQGDAVVSYRELALRSRHLANGLAKLGIVSGDRVAIWLPNVTAWMELLLACGRLGAIAVALNTRFRSGEISDILHRSQARVLVFWPGFNDIAFADILDGIPDEQLEFLETVIAYDQDGSAAAATICGKVAVPFHQLARSEPWSGLEPDTNTGCLIITTSGTTSRPKFVLHSQRGLVTHAHDIAAIPGFYGVPGSVGLALMPLCGAFGLNQTLAALAGGAPTVLLTTFHPYETAAAIRRHSVTTMAAVDDVFYKILDAFPEPVPFPSLRYVVYGSFNTSPRDFIRAADARSLTGVGAYGMSEFQGLFALQPGSADADRRSRGGGFLASSLAKIRVRDPDSGQLLPPGEAGELEVSAPSMMLCYFGDEEATAAAFTDDGFIRTGDLGLLTSDGGFEFLSRIGDTMRLGGFLVSPLEISAHLETHPSVQECQVVAAHVSEGYRPVAFVIPAPGAHIDEAGLAAHCARVLAKYKVPSRYFALNEFPFTDGPNGRKVQRSTLRSMAEKSSLE